MDSNTRRKRLRSDTLPEEGTTLPSKCRKRQSSDEQQDSALPSNILDRLNALQPSDCDEQNTSPLFRTLSPEIRNKIFGLVLQPAVKSPEEQDVIANFQKEEVEGAIVQNDITSTYTVHTELLRTCRLAYVQWRCVPIDDLVVEYVGTWFRQLQEGTVYLSRYGMIFHSSNLPGYSLS